MLFAITGLLGCPVRTEDGHAGTVKDYLFDDRNWRIRWMVVDTGAWLPGRKILIHPSAIERLVIPPWNGGLGMGSGVDTLVVSVALTQDEIKASPDASEDEPVTQQMEDRLYDYYRWDPIWGATIFGTNGISSPISASSVDPDPRGHGRNRGGNPSRRWRFAPAQRIDCDRLPCRGDEWRDRPCRELPDRRCRLEHPLPLDRDAQLVARQTCPAGASHSRSS